jgi:hypothetical protein
VHSSATRAATCHKDARRAGLVAMQPARPNSLVQCCPTCAHKQHRGSTSPGSALRFFVGDLHLASRRFATRHRSSRRGSPSVELAARTDERLAQAWSKGHAPRTTLSDLSAARRLGSRRLTCGRLALTTSLASATEPPRSSLGARDYGRFPRFHPAAVRCRVLSARLSVRGPSSNRNSP